MLGKGKEAFSATVGAVHLYTLVIRVCFRRFVVTKMNSIGFLYFMDLIFGVRPSV